MSNRRLLWPASLLITLALLQCLNLLLVRSEPLRILSSNLIQALSALVAAALLVASAIMLRRKGSPSASGWTLIAAAACFWALGMIAFMVLEVGLKRHAYPGFPDAFLFAFYPLAVYGLLMLPQRTLSREEKLNSAIDIAALTILTAMAIWQFNVQQLLRNLLAHPSLASQFSLVYTCLDMLFLWVLFVVLVRQVVYSSEFPSILALVAGCFFLAVADLMRGHIILRTHFVSGTMADLGWVLFTTLAGLSATVRLASPDVSAPGVRPPGPSFVARTVIVAVITYLWVAATLALLVWDLFLPGAGSPYSLLAGVIVVFGLAIYRQVRSIKDNASLWGLLERANMELETRVRKRTAELQTQTERIRESEITLRASESRLFAVFDSVDKVAVQGYRPDGAITFWNKASEDLYGFSRSEVLGKDIVEWLLTPETRDAERLTMAEAVSTGVPPPSGELPVRRKDGKKLWVYANRILISQPGKEPEFFCFDVDITERKRTELALQRSEEKYRQLVETTGTGYLIMDLQGQVIDANAEYVRLAGRQHLDEIVGHSVLEWTAPYDVERNRLEIRKCIENCSVRDLTIDYVSPEGRITPIEINATLVDAADDMVIITLCRDISERRQAEEALRLTQFSVDHASDAAYWIDSEARFVYVNDEACRSLGYSREELLGMTIFDIDPIFSREQWGQTWQEMQQQGSVSLETLHKTKSGEVFPVEVSAIFLDYGGKKYDFAFARNISERKQAEEEKRHFYRETIKSVTQGKLDLVSLQEVEEYLDTAELTTDVASIADAAAVRHSIREFCVSKGFDDDRLSLFETAVGEAMTNALKHGADCRVCAGVVGGFIWVAISDTGPGISTLTLPGATLRKGFSTKASLGMGYTIMMEGTDTILLSTGPQGTTVILSVRITKSEQPLFLGDLHDTWDDLPTVVQ